MGFLTPYLVVVFLVVVASGKSATPDDGSASTTVAPEDTNTDQTTEVEEMKTAETELSADTTAKTSPKSEDKKSDQDDPTDGEITLEDLLLFGSLFGGDADDALDENNQRKPDKMNKENPDDIATDSTNPADLKVVDGSDGIRRQGEVNPSFNPNKMNSDIQYDDAQQDGRSNLPYIQNSQSLNRDNIQDDVVELQLTEGGYNKPFARLERPSGNNRFASISDNSQQPVKMLEAPDRSSSRRQLGRPILSPRYPIPPQFPFTTFRPMFQPALDSSGRNMLPINHVLPAPNGMINTPPTHYADYRAAGFQAPIPGTDPGVFSNFGQTPNNAALFQSPNRNPFQDTSLLFQSAPQVQPQPILIDPSGNLPSPFQQDPLSAFTNFGNSDDSSRSNYAAFFGEPAGNHQFQVPPNFFGPNLNRVNAFNPPPVSFLPANSRERLPTQITTYLPDRKTQNGQNVNDQQPESEASQEEKTTSTASQEDVNAGRINDELPFGTRLQDKDETDVYIRYPTNEAGYAVEETLPPQNISGDAKISDKQAEAEQRNSPNIDPYANALNLLQSGQRINSSFGIPPPPPIFRSPINFGYQSPQNPIMVQYPDRNREIPSFTRPDFNLRNPFNDLPSLPENNYGFMRGNAPRQSNQETAETPSCAKKNNISFCFEDREYPSNAIMFSLNSDAFLIDQLSGSDQLLNSVNLVEKNASIAEQTTETYACPVDIKYGSPLRAKNVAGDWRIIVSLEGKFWQTVRLEVCKPLGDPCKYADPKVKTSCVQKYSVQRFMVWSPNRGVFSDLFKLPVACSCQILDTDLQQ